MTVNGKVPNDARITIALTKVDAMKLSTFGHGLGRGPANRLQNSQRSPCTIYDDVRLYILQKMTP